MHHGWIMLTFGEDRRQVCKKAGASNMHPSIHFSVCRWQAMTAVVLRTFVFIGCLFVAAAPKGGVNIWVLHTWCQLLLGLLCSCPTLPPLSVGRIYIIYLYFGPSLQDCLELLRYNYMWHYPPGCRILGGKGASLISFCHRIFQACPLCAFVPSTQTSLMKLHLHCGTCCVVWLLYSASDNHSPFRTCQLPILLPLPNLHTSTI